MRHFVKIYHHPGNRRNRMVTAAILSKLQIHHRINTLRTKKFRPLQGRDLPENQSELETEGRLTITGKASRGYPYHCRWFWCIIKPVMTLILIKALVSVCAVTGIVFIAERNPRIGGLLTGLPLGAGIVLFFYAFEQGPHFVVDSIPYGIAGLSATLAFAAGFFLGGRLFPHHRLLHPTAAAACGLAAFFLMGFFISRLRIDLPTAIVLVVAGMLLSLLLFTTVAAKKVVTREKFTFPVLIFRLLFVTTAILVITGSASFFGQKWAGVMASFPSTLCPVLIVLAYSHSDKVYPNYLRHFSYGITTLVVYYIQVLILYPRVGIYSGTACAYLTCLLYLYLLSKLAKLFFAHTRKSVSYHL